MWFCRQCNQWYNDNIHVFRHIQSLHNKAKSTNKNSVTMVSDRIMAPGSVFTNKQISILKSAKSLGIIRKSQYVKVKPNEHKLMNGFQLPKTPVKTSSSSKDQMSVPGILPKSVKSGSPTPMTKKVKVMQIAKANDLASLSKLIAKKMTKPTTLEQIKTYICKYCCRKFPNSNLLDMHQKSHGPNPNHACHICGAIASNFSSLMCHYVKHSSGKSSDHHAVLDKGKVKVEDTVKKIRKEEIGISCTQCKRTFNTKEVFNIHYCPALNKKNEYVCTYCRKITTTVEEYRDHIQSHSTPQFVCSSCNTQFSKKSQLSAHVNICPRKRLKSKKSPTGSSLSKGKTKLAAPQIKTPPPQPKKSSKKGILKTTCLDVKNDKATEQPLGNKVTSPVKEDNSVIVNDSIFNQNVSDLVHVEDMDDTSTNLLEQAETSSPPKTKTVVKRRRRRRRTTMELLSPGSESAQERPIRNLRSPSRYVADVNSAYAPTRRSARLVNRKKITFSDEEELSEHETPLEGSIQQDMPNETMKCGGEAVMNIECPESVLENEHPEVVIKQEYPEEEVTKKNTPKRRIRKSQNKATALYCQVCSLLFRSAGSLRRHKKMHTGKPQFVCQFCGKFFFRRDIHLRHENSVHQNSADKGFCCYYCKQRFESSELLKEHSTEAHVTKALVPERIRRCTGIIKCSGLAKTAKKNKPVAMFVCEKKDIKKELVEIATVSSIYDNGASSTAQPLTKACICPEVDEDYSTLNTDSQECIDVKPTAFELRQCILQKELSNCHDTILSERPIATCSSKLSPKEMIANTGSTIGNNNNNNSCLARFNSCNVCRLCSKELTENSICCPQVTHKAVDWYQCLVCAYSGTKMQVQEHMLTHTSKIGTVVVSEEDQNYNSVRTFLPLFSDALDVPEEDDDERNVLQQISETNVLRENGDSNSSCTLMEEVKCVKCGEVIIDLEVLTQHLCMEIGHSSYSCFIEFCHYNADTKPSIQKHLTENHYVSFFADVLSKPTFKRKAPEKQHYKGVPPFKRYTQQIENIFIEPSLES